MKELEELRAALEQQRPPAWGELPDLGLYMDQVVSYLPAQMLHYREEDVLTASMIHNYSTGGLIPRPQGKRYYRTHLSYLVAVMALKQVVSAQDARLILNCGMRDKSVDVMYDKFIGVLDTAMDHTASHLDADTGEEELAELAASLALHSYADKLACERVLDILREKQEEHKDNRSTQEGGAQR